MSEIFKNAITSIKLGIEDFQTGADDRMLSAARNYYAGLLLLAKECLVNAVPDADAMEIIGAKFKPVPDGDGGVDHVVMGYTTVDLAQLKTRFKDFGLEWPDVSITNLQRFRNDLEHYHLKEPAGALSEAIASSFPMVVDFFEILGEDPQEYLQDVWETILSERAAFEKVQAACLASWKPVKWPGEVQNLDRINCPNCQSSLIGQADPENTDHNAVNGKCFQCGEEIGFEEMIKLVVKASYEISDYLLAKEGLAPAVVDCPDCNATAYVETGYDSICFVCGESVARTCYECSADIDVHDYSYDHEDLCSDCANKHD